MKHFLLGIFLFIYSHTFAQWPTFNQAHPVSCQWPPYNYIDDGAFENVFIVDTNPDYFDGYMTFGRGVLCNPGTTPNALRVYSSKINIGGDLLYWTRYDSADIDRSQAWYGGSGYRNGGMTVNHNNDVISTLTNYDVTLGADADVNYLVTFNFLGSIKSLHIIDTTANQYFFSSIIEDPIDSTYLISGYYKGQGNEQGSGTLFKLDSLGGIIWQSYFSDTNTAISVKKSMDGGFWLILITPVLGECSDGWFMDSNLILIKTNDQGFEEGRFVFGGECSNERASVYEFEEDKVVLFGRLTNDSNPNPIPFAGYLFSTQIEQENTGALIVTSPMRQYLPTSDGHFVDLHKTQGGNYLVVCDNQLTVNQGAGLQGRWKGGILALDSSKDSLWFRSYSYFNNFPTGAGARPAYHYLLDSKPTADNGLVLCGYIKQMSGDPNNGLDTPWIFKVDSMGCIEPGCQYVDVEEIVIGLENTINAFPNPAHDVVNLAFTFPADFIPNNQNEIVVIDMQGREVLRQAISLFPSTTNNFEINISSLSTGMYTLHWLSNDAWLDSVKVVVE